MITRGTTATRILAFVAALLLMPAFAQKPSPQDVDGAPPAGKVPSEMVVPEPQPDPQPNPQPAPDPIPMVIDEGAPPAPDPIPMAVGDDAELSARIEGAMAGLEGTFEAGEADAFRAMLADHPDAEGEAFFGQTTFLRRHFDRSAWFYGADAIRRPDSAAALNNFASMLEEVYLASPDEFPDEWLDLAVDALTRARALDPENSGILNNLGRAMISQWQVDPDAISLEDAIALLEEARAARPDDMVVLGNLARAYNAAGDHARAAEVLNEMHRIRSTHPSLNVAGEEMSDDASRQYSEAPRDYCNVDYRCREICPPSIIGTVNLVSCELDQDTARNLCRAGQPYPQRYDCVGEIPEFGFQIPGLHPGFGVHTPWGSVHANTDGDGNVRWRVEVGPNYGPVNPYVRFDGGYDPSGGWTVSEYRGGIKYNLVHRNPVGQESGRFGFQPGYIQGESTGGGPTTLSGGVYGNGTIVR